MNKTIQFLICLFCLGAIITPAKGQMYEAAFSRWDNALNSGQGYANSNNLNGVLAWDESRIMDSYLIMYRHTNARTHLDRLFEHVALVLDQRDDRAGRNNYLGQQNPTFA